LLLLLLVVVLPLLLLLLKMLALVLLLLMRLLRISGVMAFADSNWVLLLLLLTMLVGRGSTVRLGEGV
jgi:hypothetical protein